MTILVWLESDAVEIRGRVHHGVVVLEGEPNLLEGAAVSALYPVAPLGVCLFNAR